MSGPVDVLYTKQNYNGTGPMTLDIISQKLFSNAMRDTLPFNHKL